MSRVSIIHYQSIYSDSYSNGTFHTLVYIHYLDYIHLHFVTLPFPIRVRLTVPSVDQPDGSRCAVSAWIALRNYPSTEAQRCHSFPVITHTPQRPGQVTCRWAITKQVPPFARLPTKHTCSRRAISGTAIPSICCGTTKTLDTPTQSSLF